MYKLYKPSSKTINSLSSACSCFFACAAGWPSLLRPSPTPIYFFLAVHGQVGEGKKALLFANISGITAPDRQKDDNEL
jgi:hypothetical protein